MNSIFNFNKDKTKIVGNVNAPRKSVEDIKLERIALDRKIYGVKIENKNKTPLNTKDMIAARRNLNK
ncbi:MAG: hypothetical protein RR404_02365 [Bacilli bacterium]